MNVSFRLRQAIKNLPGVLTLQFHTLRRASADQLVGRSTAVCIEGFPRSGNGYAVSCVAKGLPQLADRVAHHTHSCANVRRAVSRGIPTYVVVREPYESCASLVAFGVCRRLDDALEAYADFHRWLLPMLDRIEIIPFADLAAEPDRFVLQVARDLGLSPVHEGETLAQRLARSKWPGAELGERKQDILRRPLSARSEDALRGCQAIYAQVLTRARTAQPSDRQLSRS